jgi:hypothetical protein
MTQVINIYLETTVRSRKWLSRASYLLCHKGGLV